MLPQNYWKIWLEFRKLKPQDSGYALLRQDLLKQRQAMLTSLAERCLLTWVQDPSPMLGRSAQTWFWFNHFNVHAAKGQVGVLLASYWHEALQPQVQGRFADMLQAATLHPAMLVYLDNASNVRGRGNENHARELLELHTLGVQGGYTQADVQALARAMTGWGVDFASFASGQPERAVFFSKRHDPAQVQVLGQSVQGAGAQVLPAVLQRLAAHPRTAQHIAQRMCVWAVTDEPPAAWVQHVATVFTESGGSLPLVWAEVQVLRQRWRQQGGALSFTDPLRYTVAALQLLCNGQPLHNLKPVLRWLQLLGQPWFGRSTPDGYPLRGDAWLNTGQLTQRVELAREMVASLPTLLGWPDAAARAEHAQTVLDSDRGRALQAWLPPSARAVLQRTRQPHEALALLLASPACMFH